jgi:hypothetical protein
MCSLCVPIVRVLLFVMLFVCSTDAMAQTMTAKNEIEESLLDMLDYYRQPGAMTDPGEYSHLLVDLPDDIPGLCKVVQGVMLHIFWSEAYGVKLSEEKKEEVNLRKVERMLSRMVELDERSINTTRDPEKRLVGNCRDHSVLLCALLRYKGIPARARCGFGTYFTPGKYMDHWICEYWNDHERRWVRVDAQLDSLQVATLQIDFDPHDLPAGKFLNGGQAWQQCRSGKIDPDLCGIFDMKGLWFVQGDLVRDFMALNKLEVLPWDCNEHMGGPDVEVGPEEYSLLDRIARLITSGDPAFTEIRSLYEYDERLRMDADWQP